MRDKQGFRGWLDLNPNLSDNSRRRYANAIDQLSKMYSIKLYGSTDTSGIDTIKSNPKFKDWNDSQGNMFSASLNHFRNYLNLCNEIDEEEINTVILKEKLEYEKEQKKVTPRKINNKITIDDKPETKPDFTLVKGRKVWKRNPIYAIEAVLFANYLCEIDKEHKHFISKTTKENYVEAHHLIPIRFQDGFNKSLDTRSNIVSVCVACHKQIHNGLFKEKKELLVTLFEKRRKRLISSGINIDIEDFLSYYQD